MKKKTSYVRNSYRYELRAVNESQNFDSSIQITKQIDVIERRKPLRFEDRERNRYLSLINKTF